MSRVAIMQPYFMPYIGYFQLINSVDKFVVYDDIEYTKKGWFNRNRILENDHDKMFTIPIKNDSDFLPVNQRYLSDDSEVQIAKILRSIEANYKKAPYYEQALPLVRECLLQTEKNLFEYIFGSIKKTINYLDIPDRIVLSSSMAESYAGLKGKDMVMAICKKVGADNYINPIGGQELYSKEEFAQNGINLYFLKTGNISYQQLEGPFVPSLSIIDVIMFNPKDRIKEMLQDYELI